MPVPDGRPYFLEKVAPTDWEVLMVTVHWAAPEHAPVQPVNRERAAAEAVSVTLCPLA